MLSKLERSGNVEADLDITCGKILVITETTADLDKIRSVTDKLPDVVLEVVQASKVVARPTDRYDHHNDDQDGGLAYTNVNVNSGLTSGGSCTARIYWNRGSDGQWGFTAAHCLRGQVHDTVAVNDCGYRFRQGGVSLNPVNDLSNCTFYVMGGAVDVVIFAKYPNQKGDAEHITHGANHTRQGMG